MLALAISAYIFVCIKLCALGAVALIYTNYELFYSFTGVLN